MRTRITERFSIDIEKIDAWFITDEDVSISGGREIVLSFDKYWKEEAVRMKEILLGVDVTWINEGRNRTRD